jgi:hypothetical protein
MDLSGMCPLSAIKDRPLCRRSGSVRGPDPMVPSKANLVSFCKREESPSEKVPNPTSLGRCSLRARIFRELEENPKMSSRHSQLSEIFSAPTDQEFFQEVNEQYLRIDTAVRRDIVPIRPQISFTYVLPVCRLFSEFGLISAFCLGF